MPFHFISIDDISELTRFRSVLIVPCRFCPAASSSIHNNEPYFAFLRHALKTASYEREITLLKSQLEENTINADVFESHLLHHFVLCMWTAKRRHKLLQIARRYDALLVLGCEAAVNTIRDAVRSSSCEVVQGLKTLGVMSIQPRLHWPANISLDLQSVTPLELSPRA